MKIQTKTSLLILTILLMISFGIGSVIGITLGI
jgi:hypothetical protein